MNDKKAFGSLKKRLCELMGTAAEMAKNAEGQDQPVMDMVQAQLHAAYKSLLISEGILFPAAELAKRPKPEKQDYGEMGVVRMAAGEYEKLLAVYGEETVTDYVGRVERHCRSKRVTYHDYYATILNWLKSDGVKPRGGQPKGLDARLLEQLMEK